MIGVLSSAGAYANGQEEAVRALRGLLSDEGLGALTIAEVSPAHAAAEEGLLERFAAAVAESIQPPSS